MRKITKRVMSLALAMILAVGMAAAVPLQAGAVGMQAGPPIVDVYTTIIAYAGQEWYVIGDENGGVSTGNSGHVTLLLKTGQTGARPYADSVFGSNHVYDNSTLHTAMQGVYNGFPARERDASLIIARTLDGVNNSASGNGDETMSPPQFVWPLSQAEYVTVYNATQSNGYSELLKYSGSWWLRSPDPSFPLYALVGFSDGSFWFNDLVSYPLAVRPAFILNLSPAIFTSDASGASTKSSVTAGDWSSAGSLQTTGAIKLTLPDSGLTLASPTITAVSGNTITFSYDATTSTSTYNRLSAIVTDSGGAVKYYGNLADTSVGSGTASVTVPDGLAAGDQLLVFVEMVNTDASLLSDFAGNRAQITFSTQAAPTGLGKEDETAALNDGKITGLVGTSAYEYKLASASTWTAVAAGATEITDLAPGSYQVRLAGSLSSTTLASPATDVTVGAYTAPPSNSTDTTTTPAQQGPGSPQTGDSSNMGLWVALLCVSLATLVLGVVMLYRRRKSA